MTDAGASVSIGELRKRAQRVLDRVSISEVRLGSLSCSSAPFIEAGALEVTTEISFKADMHTSEEALDSRLRYRLVAANPESQKEAWSLEFELVGTFVADEGHDLAGLEPMDLSAFTFGIAIMHLHPYARETAQSMTGRMGYPPFTMDSLTPPFSARDDEMIELEEA